jgi:type III pantothenate kinase
VILTSNIGNRTISLGVYDCEGKQLFSSSVATEYTLTPDEMKIKLRNVFSLYSIAPEDITGAIISTVVPPVTALVEDAVSGITGKKPLIVGPGLKTGVRINIDYPNELGADIVATAAGALAKYAPPFILVDMGTATCISAVDKDGCYQGCAICPGVRLSYDALAAATAQLPQISIGEVQRVIGKSSVESMHSGLIYGFASMLDGMLDRFCGELGESSPPFGASPPKEAKIIATGRIAENLLKHCKREISFDGSLLMDGLYSIYVKNAQYIKNTQKKKR